MLRAKYLPILLYATEACPMLSRDKHSLEFTTTRLFVKIFRTGSAGVIVECQRNFNFLPINLQLIVRTANFLQSFTASVNTLCLLFERQALNQLRFIFSAYGNMHTGCQHRNVVFEQLMSSS